MIVIRSGMLEEGYTFIGPFLDFDHAGTYARKHGFHDTPHTSLSLVDPELEDAQLVDIKPCIIAHGGLETGFQFVGPFPNRLAALAWGRRNPMSDYWLMIVLQDPSGG